MDDIYYDVLRKSEKEGLVIIDGDMVRLTDYGIDVSNIVLADGTRYGTWYRTWYRK